MNAIVGFSQLMLRHYNNPDKVRNYAEKIVVSSQHLLRLINDVLDMSKIESGKTTLNLCDVNLADIVKETDNIIRTEKDIIYRLIPFLQMLYIGKYRLFLFFYASCLLCF